MTVRTLASVAILALLASSSSASLYVDSSIAVQFANFKAKYGKTYSSVAEEMRRMRIFEDNLQVAMLAQAANPQAKFGVTKFSDLTRDEFQATYANGAAHFAAAKKKSASKKRVSAKKATKDVPETLDWRNVGAVTPVKDQGQCGSCWAFSAIGNIEGRWFLAGNELVNLSEQQLVSCDDVDGACEGGLMDQAYEWLIDNHEGTVFTEESYPYESGDGDVPECTENGHVVGAAIADYEFVEEDEDEMAAYLANNGPIAIAVDAKMFQFYQSGVMTYCLPLWMDHGVVLVGYDNTASTPYWIVKNSWGTGWGEDGYIRIRKGTDECLISSYPVSAIARK